MDPYQGGQVEMFMNVTGASEAVAFQNLQAHGGDLNAAINNFYNEGENFVPHMQSADGNRADWMEDDEPLPRQPILPSIPPSFPLPSIPSWATRLRAAGVEDTNAPRPSTRNTTSVVYQPRDVRAVPIDWRDEEEPRVRPHAGSGPLIEEIPATEASQLPSQSHGRIIIDDEDVPSTASSVLRTGGEVGGRSLYGNNNFTQDFPPGNSSLNPPLIDEIPANDIEEEMLRAAIEASRKEAEAATRRMMPDYTEDLSVVEGDEARMNTEEDDLARAVSMSLKTAEREKAIRESQGSLVIPEDGFMREEDVQDPVFEDGRKQDTLKRWGSASTADNSTFHAGILSDSLPAEDSNLKKPMAGGSSVLSSTTEDVEELEEPPLVRRRSNRRLQPPVDSAAPQQGSPGPHLDSTNGASIPADDFPPSAPLQRNGDAFHNDEWGGISSEEQEEAVMLEAALFGSLPEDAALRFRYATMHGIAGDSEEPLIDDTGTNSFPRPIPQPPSPTVVAQRRLREQQDDEYLASLEADREKEIKAQIEAEARRLKEAEAKAAAYAKEKLRQEEELRKKVVEEELKKQSAAKKASLPDEPSGDDESAVTLLVRMPDGTRQGRRFRKSDALQSLFDFMDVSGGVLPGSYRLVRQYPRQAFTDAEHGQSFSDLGLTSKHEALFLELI